MARYHTIAGHFKEIVEKQKTTIMQNTPVLDDKGVPKWEDNKPLIQSIPVEVEVDVKNVVWVDQVNIPFTEEEEKQRDLEEAQHEIELAKRKEEEFAEKKKMAIDNLTLRNAESLLMATVADSEKIKAEYQARRKSIMEASTEEELNKLIDVK